MNQKRIGIHLLFWILYLSISVFTELYLSGSHSLNNSIDLLKQVFWGQFLLLSVKIPAVYYTLYSLIPRWLKQPNKIILFAEAFFALSVAIIAYRMMIHWVIWPFITHSTPKSLTTLEFTARLFYSFFDIIQVVGVAAAIKLFRLRIAAIENEKTLIQEKLRSEMLHLKSQINPHFLFNMLNSIYALARNQSPITADTVMKLSKILRYMLYETGNKTIAIDEELKIIDDYIELQLLRFGNRLQVIIDREIDTTSQIAPLLLFPLIENAFKHGTGEELSKIHFHLKLKDHQLVVVISNPIVTSSIPSNGNDGIGLPNLSRQLQLLYKDYSFNHEVNNNYFFVTLRINLLTYAGFELFDSRR